jgi:hypothetical protein
MKKKQFFFVYFAKPSGSYKQKKYDNIKKGDKAPDFQD